MTFSYVRDLVLLFIGDLIVFTGSLWLALVARHFVAPNSAQFFEHLLPFSVLFALWLLVFVVVGLYDRHVALFEHRLPATITEAQVINMALAVLFFFLAPIAIQPKTILVLYFVISTSLIVVWRLGIFRLRVGVRGAERAVLVGTGPDLDELEAAVKASPRTRLECVARVAATGQDSKERTAEIARVLSDTRASLVIKDPRVHLDVIPRSVKEESVVDASELYEALLSRVPLSMVDRERLISRAHSRESRLYGLLKRIMDLVLALVLGALSLVAYPFVWCAIKLDDGGDLFVHQERVGQGGLPFTMYKFRTMSGNDRGEYGADGKTKLRVTRVGNFLRTSRIDELPQLWSVMKGDQSLVGPRPELPALVERYRAEIPLYDLRHLVTPGLSGWAQIYHQAHPHHGTNVEETARKLSYDLYYIKHRSLLLDLDISLKTMKTLALRFGA